jgi:hypothetical protein
MQSFVGVLAMDVEKPEDSVQGKGRCGNCGQNYTTSRIFRKKWIEVELGWM